MRIAKWFLYSVALVSSTYAVWRLWRRTLLQNTDTFQQGKMNANAPVKVYGFPDAWADFDRRHPQWSDVFSRLGKVIDMAFSRKQVMDTKIEKFVYFYGNLVAEDFMELFLMAANGYGYGAMKLLRSMYEHTITLKYLHDHPDEFEAFFDFDRVQQHRLMKPIFDTFGESVLSAEIVAETERRYEEVKEKFMVKSCKSKTCGEKRVGPTWSKLDFVSMAKTTGAIGSLIVPGYYIPLRHAHSTLRAMMERLERRDEHLGFERESQPEEADQALMTAHNCVLVALEIQDEQFKILGLKSAVENGIRDWALIWSPESLTQEVEAAEST
jgi:hypothetical protein